MKPPLFDYYAPATLPEVLDLLARTGGDAKILAGGQSLVPVLNMRLARPTALIDVNQVRELDYLRVEGDELVLGALVRHRALERNTVARKFCPLLPDAVRHVGHVQIRNRGTICGSIAHADPAAELPAVVAGLGGSVVLASHEGRRTLPAAEFFLGFFMTALQPHEMLVEVRVPAVTGRVGSAFMEVSRRHGDFALCGVGVQVQLDDVGRVARAWIGLSGVGPGPVVPAEAVALLTGERPSAAAVAAVAQQVQRSCEPESDLHGTAEYRLHLAKVLTRRALEEALRQAAGGGETL